MISILVQKAHDLYEHFYDRGLKIKFSKNCLVEGLKCRKINEILPDSFLVCLPEGDIDG